MRGIEGRPQHVWSSGPAPTWTGFAPSRDVIKLTAKGTRKAKKRAMSSMGGKGGGRQKGVTRKLLEPRAVTRRRQERSGGLCGDLLERPLTRTQPTSARRKQDQAKQEKTQDVFGPMFLCTGMCLLFLQASALDVDRSLSMCGSLCPSRSWPLTALLAPSLTPYFSDRYHSVNHSSQKPFQGQSSRSARGEMIQIRCSLSPVNCCPTVLQHRVTYLDLRFSTSSLCSVHLYLRTSSGLKFSAFLHRFWNT